MGSFSWSGGAFLYPQKKNPTFINMSQEHVDMRDSYLGETRLWLGAGQEMGCLGRTGAWGWGISPDLSVGDLLRAGFLGWPPVPHLGAEFPTELHLRKSQSCQVLDQKQP